LAHHQPMLDLLPAVQQAASAQVKRPLQIDAIKSVPPRAISVS